MIVLAEVHTYADGAVAAFTATTMLLVGGFEFFTADTENQARRRRERAVGAIFAVGGVLGILAIVLVIVEMHVKTLSKPEVTERTERMVTTP